MLQRTEPMVHFWHLSRTNPWAQAGRPLETQDFEAVVVFMLSIWSVVVVVVVDVVADESSSVQVIAGLFVCTGGVKNEEWGGDGDVLLAFYAVSRPASCLVRVLSAGELKAVRQPHRHRNSLFRIMSPVFRRQPHLGIYFLLLRSPDVCPVPVCLFLGRYVRKTRMQSRDMQSRDMQNREKKNTLCTPLFSWRQEIKASLPSLPVPFPSF